MEMFAPVSNLIAKQNDPGTYGVRQQQANAPKMQAASNVSKNGSASIVDDVVSISEDAKKMASKDLVKLSGSIKINNNRIKYSLTNSNDLVITIIDKKSNEVVRQIPAEEMIKIKEMLSKVLEEEVEI